MLEIMAIVCDSSVKTTATLIYQVLITRHSSQQKRKIHKVFSPSKPGQPETITPECTKALAISCLMMQVSEGEGEASQRNFYAIVKAMIDETQWEQRFNVDFAWRQAQKEHPDYFFPAKVKYHEAHCS